MKAFKPVLILLLAVMFVSTTAVWAKRITGKRNGQILRVDAAGNLTLNGPLILVTMRGIKFPRSGVIINRWNGKTTNESGSPQRFVNPPLNPAIFDPETGGFTVPANRHVVRVGKPNKRTFASIRHTAVFRP